MNSEYKLLKENALKIKRSLSNLIWLDGVEQFTSFATLIGKSTYISAIELSLYNIFGTVDLNDDDLKLITNELQLCGVEISGLHNIFADDKRFNESLLHSDEIYTLALQRIEKFIEYSEKLGVKHLSLDYFFALDRGEMSKRDADRRFLSFLDRVEEMLTGKDVTTHIVPSTGDYLSNYVEAVNLLQKRGYQKIKILVDLVEVFNTFSNDIKFFREKERFFSHFHISNLDGKPASFDDIPMHNKVVNLSHYMGYKNSYFVMKVPNLDSELKDDLDNYQHYIHIFKEIYQVPIALSPFCSLLFPNLVYRHLSPEGPDKDHLRNLANH